MSYNELKVQLTTRLIFQLSSVYSVSNIFYFNKYFINKKDYYYKFMIRKFTF